MTNYKVTLQFLYSDVVHVKAHSKKEAERLALEECHEQYECFYDSDIVEEDYLPEDDLPF